MDENGNGMEWKEMEWMKEMDGWKWNGGRNGRKGKLRNTPIWPVDILLFNLPQDLVDSA